MTEVWLPPGKHTHTITRTHTLAHSLKHNTHTHHLLFITLQSRAWIRSMMSSCLCAHIHLNISNLMFSLNIMSWRLWWWCQRDRSWCSSQLYEFLSAAEEDILKNVCNRTMAVPLSKIWQCFIWVNYPYNAVSRSVCLVLIGLLHRAVYWCYSSITMLKYPWCRCMFLNDSIIGPLVMFRMHINDHLNTYVSSFFAVFLC